MALFSRFIPCGVWEAVHLIEGLLANTSDIQPSTVHADTQGQNFPVFTLATLFGFDLMPRIRNFKDLIFFRASEKIICGSWSPRAGRSPPTSSARSRPTCGPTSAASARTPPRAAPSAGSVRPLLKELDFTDLELAA